MSYTVELSDESLIELKAARDYYSEISNNLLQKFDLEIKYTIDKLEGNPLYFQKLYRNIKIVFTKTFPFGIHYLVEGTTISIQRILHQKQYYK